MGNENFEQDRRRKKTEEGYIRITYGEVYIKKIAMAGIFRKDIKEKNNNTNSVEKACR